MMSIYPMSAGKGNYYAQLAREDYYLAGGEPPGYWLGDGAAHVGLTGLLRKEDFHQLFGGFAVQGRRLVQNAGDDRRQPGWDLTFSPPKSVSTLWSQLPPELGAEIRAGHAQAVETAMRYLQEAAAYTRRGKGGAIRQKALLFAAAFEHGTSRAQDPQLHTHVLLFNTCVRPDGSTGSIVSQLIYQHKMSAGAVYRAEMAYQLQQRLGLTLEVTKDWFEIRGVDPSLVREFSKRRAAIEARLREMNLSSARASEKAALDTRSVKEDTSRRELFARWQVTGQEYGFGPEVAQALVQPAFPIGPEAKAKALELTGPTAVGVVTKQNAHFPEKDLVRRMAERGTGQGLTAEELIRAAREYLQSPQVVPLGHYQGYEQFTTKENKRLEEKLLAGVGHLARQKGPVLEFEADAERKLNEEQKHAIEHITRKEGMVKVVSGFAGTGKTTLLNAAHEDWRQGGLRVAGVCLAGKTERGLESETGIPCRTIASFLYRAENGYDSGPAPHVLVVDEAGMVGTLQMAGLVDYCVRNNTKLVLVGDGQQLQPIEAGGPFIGIIRREGDAKLTTIVRQHEEWRRVAVTNMATGKAAAALAAYEESGDLVISDTHEEARRLLLEEWRREGVKKPEEHLILTGTREEARRLNRDIQTLRRLDGALGASNVSVGSFEVHTGDRLLFTKKSKMLKVENGDLATVVEVFPRFERVRVKLDSGREFTFSPKDYNDLSLGYAFTTHKAQGATVNHAYALLDPQMEDRHLFYVQLSRARGRTLLFAAKDDFSDPDQRSPEHDMLKDLTRTLSRDRTKLLASDILIPKDSDLERKLEQLERLEYKRTRHISP